MRFVFYPSPSSFATGTNLPSPHFCFCAEAYIHRRFSSSLLFFCGLLKYHLPSPPLVCKRCILTCKPSFSRSGRVHSLHAYLVENPQPTDPPPLMSPRPHLPGLRALIGPRRVGRCGGHRGGAEGGGVADVDPVNDNHGGVRRHCHRYLRVHRLRRFHVRHRELCR